MNFNQETLWDAIIVLGGIVCFFLIFQKNMKLKKIRKKLGKCSVSVVVEDDNASVNGILTEAIIKTKTDFNAINETRKDFNELSAKLNSDIQLISLFPMLGLLGTVYGLMNAMKGSINNLDLEQLSLALSTTFFGLICAMLLKFYSIMIPLKEMEIIEAKLEEEDYKFNQLINMGKIKSKTSNLGNN